VIILIEENNLRRIYGEDHALSNRKINYVFYSKLLVLSKYDYDNNIRYLIKDELSGVLYKTTGQYNKFRGKIKTLVDNNVITEDKDKIYFEKGTHFFITEKETLKYLSDTTNSDVIRLYVALGKMDIWATKIKKERPNTDESHTRLIKYDFLAKAIGYEEATEQISKTMKNRIDLLSRLGLIEIQEVKHGKKTISKTQPSKHSFLLVSVNTKLKPKS